MNRPYKSTLQLNSYKVDTHGYQGKLKQVIQENHELKSQVQALAHKEERLTLQLNSLHHQLRAIRFKLANEPPANLQKEAQMISQLQSQRQKANQYKEMYENELMNKKDITEFYEKKLHSLLRDKDILVSKYQQKIKNISRNTLPTSSNHDSSTSISPRRSSPILNREPPKPLTKLPPAPSRPQLKTPHKKVEKTTLSEPPSQQTLINVLRPCLYQLEKMGLSLDELRYIQQIDRFTSAGIVPKNKYIKLLREFPFECTDEDEIENSYEYILTSLREQGEKQTGKNIIQFLLDKMAQLQ